MSHIEHSPTLLPSLAQATSPDLENSLSRYELRQLARMLKNPHSSSVEQRLAREMLDRGLDQPASADHMRLMRDKALGAAEEVKDHFLNRVFDTGVGISRYIITLRPSAIHVNRLLTIPAGMEGMQGSQEAQALYSRERILLPDLMEPWAAAAWHKELCRVHAANIYKTYPTRSNVTAIEKQLLKNDAWLFCRGFGLQCFFSYAAQQELIQTLKSKAPHPATGSMRFKDSCRLHHQDFCASFEGYPQPPTIATLSHMSRFGLRTFLLMDLLATNNVPISDQVAEKLLVHVSKFDPWNLGQSRQVQNVVALYHELEHRNVEPERWDRIILAHINAKDAVKRWQTEAGILTAATVVEKTASPNESNAEKTRLDATLKEQMFSGLLNVVKSRDPLIPDPERVARILFKIHRQVGTSYPALVEELIKAPSPSELANELYAKYLRPVNGKDSLKVSVTEESTEAPDPQLPEPEQEASVLIPWRPVRKWIADLDPSLKSRVDARLELMRLGETGEPGPLKHGNGIREIRIHTGPGIRIYFQTCELDGVTTYVVHEAGIKDTQDTDFANAVKRQEEFNLTGRAP